MKPLENEDERYLEQGRKVFGQTIYVTALERGTRDRCARPTHAEPLPERIEVKIWPYDNYRARLKYSRSRSIPELCRITFTPTGVQEELNEKRKEMYISQYTHCFEGSIEKPHIAAWKQDFEPCHVAHKDSKFCVLNCPVASKSRHRRERPKSAPPGSFHFDFENMNIPEPLSRRSTSPEMFIGDWMGIDETDYDVNGDDPKIFRPQAEEKVIAQSVVPYESLSSSLWDDTFNDESQDDESQDDVTRHDVTQDPMQQARSLISELRHSVKPDDFRKTYLQSVETPQAMKPTLEKVSQESLPGIKPTPVKVSQRSLPGIEPSPEKVSKGSLPWIKPSSGEEFYGSLPQMEREVAKVSKHPETIYPRTQPDKTTPKTSKVTKDGKKMKEEKGLNERLWDLIGDLEPNDRVWAFKIPQETQEMNTKHDLPSTPVESWDDVTTSPTSEVRISQSDTRVLGKKAANLMSPVSYTSQPRIDQFDGKISTRPKSQEVKVQKPEVEMISEKSESENTKKKTKDETFSHESSDIHSKVTSLSNDSRAARKSSLSSEASYKRKLTSAWIEQQRLDVQKNFTADNELKRTKSVDLHAQEFRIEEERNEVKLKHSKSELSIEQLKEMYDPFQDRNITVNNSSSSYKVPKVVLPNEPTVITRAHSVEHKLHKITYTRSISETPTKSGEEDAKNKPVQLSDAEEPKVRKLQTVCTEETPDWVTTLSNGNKTADQQTFPQKVTSQSGTSARGASRLTRIQVKHVEKKIVSGFNEDVPKKMTSSVVSVTTNEIERGRYPVVQNSDTRAAMAENRPQELKNDDEQQTPSLNGGPHYVRVHSKEKRNQFEKLTARFIKGKETAKVPPTSRCIDDLDSNNNRSNSPGVKSPVSGSAQIDVNSEKKSGAGRKGAILSALKNVKMRKAKSEPNLEPVDFEVKDCNKDERDGAVTKEKPNRYSLGSIPDVSPMSPDENEREEDQNASQVGHSDETLEKPPKKSSKKLPLKISSMYPKFKKFTRKLRIVNQLGSEAGIVSESGGNRSLGLIGNESGGNRSPGLIGSDQSTVSFVSTGADHVKTVTEDQIDAADIEDVLEGRVLGENAAKVITSTPTSEPRIDQSNGRVLGEKAVKVMTSPAPTTSEPRIDQSDGNDVNSPKIQNDVPHDGEKQQTEYVVLATKVKVTSTDGRHEDRKNEQTDGLPPPISSSNSHCNPNNIVKQNKASVGNSSSVKVVDSSETWRHENMKNKSKESHISPARSPTSVVPQNNHEQQETKETRSTVVTMVSSETWLHKETKKKSQESITTPQIATADDEIKTKTGQRNETEVGSAVEVTVGSSNKKEKKSPTHIIAPQLASTDDKMNIKRSQRREIDVGSAVNVTSTSNETDLRKKEKESPNNITSSQVASTDDKMKIKRDQRERYVGSAVDVTSSSSETDQSNKGKKSGLIRSKLSTVNMKARTKEDVTQPDDIEVKSAKNEDSETSKKISRKKDGVEKKEFGTKIKGFITKVLPFNNMRGKVSPGKEFTENDERREKVDTTSKEPERHSGISENENGYNVPVEFTGTGGVWSDVERQNNKERATTTNYPLEESQKKKDDDVLKARTYVLRQDVKITAVVNEGDVAWNKERKVSRSDKEITTVKHSSRVHHLAERATVKTIVERQQVSKFERTRIDNDKSLEKSLVGNGNTMTDVNSERQWVGSNDVMRPRKLVAMVTVDPVRTTIKDHTKEERITNTRVREDLESLDTAFDFLTSAFSDEENTRQKSMVTAAERGSRAAVDDGTKKEVTEVRRDLVSHELAAVDFLSSAAFSNEENIRDKTGVDEMSGKEAERYKEKKWKATDVEESSMVIDEDAKDCKSTSRSTSRNMANDFRNDTKKGTEEREEREIQEHERTTVDGQEKIDFFTKNNEGMAVREEERQFNGGNERKKDNDEQIKTIITEQREHERTSETIDGQEQRDFFTKKNDGMVVREEARQFNSDKEKKRASWHENESYKQIRTLTIDQREHKRANGTIDGQEKRDFFTKKNEGMVVREEARQFNRNKENKRASWHGKESYEQIRILTTDQREQDNSNSQQNSFESYKNERNSTTHRESQKYGRIKGSTIDEERYKAILIQTVPTTNTEHGQMFPSINVERETTTVKSNNLESHEEQRNVDSRGTRRGSPAFVMNHEDSATKTHQLQYVEKVTLSRSTGESEMRREARGKKETGTIQTEDKSEARGGDREEAHVKGQGGGSGDWSQNRSGDKFQGVKLEHGDFQEDGHVKGQGGASGDRSQNRNGDLEHADLMEESSIQVNVEGSEDCSRSSDEKSPGIRLDQGDDGNKEGFGYGNDSPRSSSLKASSDDELLQLIEDQIASENSNGNDSPNNTDGDTTPVPEDNPKLSSTARQTPEAMRIVDHETTEVLQSNTPPGGVLTHKMEVDGTAITPNLHTEHTVKPHMEPTSDHTDFLSNSHDMDKNRNQHQAVYGFKDTNKNSSFSFVNSNIVHMKNGDDNRRPQIMSEEITHKKDYMFSYSYPGQNSEVKPIKITTNKSKHFTKKRKPNNSKTQEEDLSIRLQKLLTDDSSVPDDSSLSINQDFASPIYSFSEDSEFDTNAKVFQNKASPGNMPLDQRQNRSLERPKRITKNIRVSRNHQVSPNEFSSDEECYPDRSRLAYRMYSKTL